MKILGLCGKAGAGKDYTYETLDKLYTGVWRVSFADELRYELNQALSPARILPALWEKPYSEEVRWILQHYGTEYRRDQNPDYWVNLTEKRLEDFSYDPAAVVVFTDVRFANEADMIRRNGGMVAEVVVRDEALRKARLGGTLPPAHASENMDFAVDAYILNDTKPEVPTLVVRWLGLTRERFRE